MEVEGRIPVTLETYDFDSDTVFQDGLKSILYPLKESNASPQEIEKTLRNAKQFYLDQLNNNPTAPSPALASIGSPNPYPSSPSTSVPPPSVTPPQLTTPSVSTTPSHPLPPAPPSSPLTPHGSSDAYGIPTLSSLPPSSSTLAPDGGGVIVGSAFNPLPGGGGGTGVRAEPTYPPSFAQLAEMIQNGEPIPGIRQIEDRLNDVGEGGTVGKMKVAKKPWEKELDRDSTAATAEDGMEM